MSVELDIPYVPSTRDHVSDMVRLAAVRPNERAVDLGCGDGRVMIALAKAGADVAGFEIEPERVQLAQSNIEKEGLAGTAKVIPVSFWDANLQDFDIVTVYGISSIMVRLGEKLRNELKPGARIVSNTFSLPTWEPVLKEGQLLLYVQVKEN
jgi:ribosomal protein L11 methylase PrmA